MQEGFAQAEAMNVVRISAWAEYRWLHHGFSTRAGGVSRIYSADAAGELNLGWTKDDDAENVLENRRRFAAEIAGGATHLIGLRQLHSSIIRTVRYDDETLETAEGRPILEGDGLLTDVPGLLLGVGVADCVPILIADVKKRAVAAIHAGWRGTLARIVEQGIGAMQLQYNSQPEDLIAAIGPSIGACCYSVGGELRSAFALEFTYATDLFSYGYGPNSAEGKQLYLDLWEANRRQLLDLGLLAERIALVGECTACTRVHFRPKYFSHRAENGFAGRMMAAIGICR